MPQTLFDLLASIKLDGSEYEKGLGQASEKTQSFGAKIGNALGTAAKVGVAALGAASGAALVFGKDAVSVGEQFDTSMSQVAATMGYSVEELNQDGSEASETFNKLRDYAQEMGASTSFSASQAADALNYMALAGYDADTSIEMLPNVLNLAAAGGMELAAASDMVTDSQSALGLSLDETSELVDKMAKASSKSNTSVSQLGSAILTVGGTAKDLAGGTTELSTALGILADNGVKGAEGGTALRNVVLSLSAPTDKAAKTMEALGIQAFDADGNLRPLEDTFRDMSGILGEMNTKDRTEVLNTLFNKVDLKSVNALLAASGDSISGIGVALENSGVEWGKYADKVWATGDVFGGLVEEVEYNINELGTSAEELQEYLQFEYELDAEDAQKVIESVTTSVENQGDRWAELSGYIDDAQGAAQAMADTQLDNLAGDLTIFQSALEGVKIAVSDEVTPALRNFVQLGTEGLSGLAAAIKEDGLGGAMEAMGPFIDDAIGMLMEGIPKLIEFGAGLLAAIVEGIINNLPKLAEGAIQIVQTLATGIMDKTPSFMESAKEIISGIGKGLRENISTLLPAAVDMIGQFAMYLTDPSTLVSIIGAAGDIIIGLIEGLVKALPELLAYIPKIIANIIAGLIAGIPKLLEVGVDLIGGLMMGMVEGVAGIIMAIPRWIGQIIDDFKNLLGIHSPSTVFQEIGDNLVAGLLAGITKAWEGITTFFSGAVESLKTFLSDTWESVRTTAETAWNLIQGVFSGAWEGIQGVWDVAVGFFSGVWSGIETAFSSVGWISDQFEAAWNLIQGAWEGVSGFFTDRWNDIQNVFATVGEAFSTIGNNIVNGLKQGVTDLWNGAKTFFANRWDDVKNIFSNALSFFSGIGKNIVTGLKNGITAAWDGAKGIGQWFKDKVGSLADGAKEELDEHSPSRVFASIGENAALGLGVGWKDKIDSVRREITDGLSFTAEPVPVAATVSVGAASVPYGAAYGTFGAGGGMDMAAFQNAIIEAFRGLSVTAQFGTDSVQSMTVSASRAYNYRRNGRG